MLAQDAPTISGFYSKKNASSTQILWVGSLNQNIAWLGNSHIPTPINERTPPFKIPPVLREKVAKKTFKPLSWAYPRNQLQTFGVLHNTRYTLPTT